MAKNILICPDLQQEHGHWYPVIALAEKFKKKDPKHNITFIGIKDCYRILTAVDTKNPLHLIPVFEDLYPEGYTSMSYDDPDTFEQRSKLMYQIATGALDSLMETIKPEVFLAGYFIAPEALMIYYKYPAYFADLKMKPIITTTYLRHPQEDPALFAQRYFLQISQEVASKLMVTVTGDSSFTGDRDSIRRFVMPLRKFKEFIFCPKEFDFKDFSKKIYYNEVDENRIPIVDERIYIESSIMGVENSPKGDGDYGDTGRNKSFASAGSQVSGKVFASAGSRVRDYPDAARKLFDELINMMGKGLFKNYSLTLAVGHSLKQEYENIVKSKSNITVIDWVNQSKEIRSASIVVTHGGLASIKECIYYNKPLLVVPLGKDQRDNAVRVNEAGVGAMISPERLSAEVLSDKALGIQVDEEMTKLRTRMHNIFVQREIEMPGVAYLQQIMSEPV